MTNSLDGQRARLAAMLGLAILCWAARPPAAQACGGLFCSLANPVNQAAEQIVFSKNADGTVTMIVQILYDGPSQKFGWVLPVPGVPDVHVSSNQALAALKQVTNPRYVLQTSLDPSCPSGGGAGLGSYKGGAGGAGGGGGVTVEASGAIGPYLYDVIKVDATLSDPAQVAVDWLTSNGYDVGDTGADVLRPYLMDGLNLIGIKLTKQATTGSIRPLMLTFESELPAIPIRPTAVAANDDMGVLVFVLGDRRAIPDNYKALELDEALIDWFNPSNNYEQVVSAAANEAGGQGFVTEYADKLATLMGSGPLIWPSFRQNQWQQFQASTSDPAQMIMQASATWGAWDGFDDALAASVTLSGSVTLSDLERCPSCYASDPSVAFDAKAFVTNLDKLVIKPMADTQALLDSRPYVTRLYTTMSAAEMTVDPAFNFNGDLSNVSNLHTAKQVLGCDASGGFRVELAQGDVVYGSQRGVWPYRVGELPAAVKILEYGTQGPGRVLQDQAAMVSAMLQANAPPTTSGTAGTTGGGGKAAGGRGSGGTGGVGANGSNSGCGCHVTGDGNAGPIAWLLLTFFALRRRRNAE